jgi:hypothetical protein
MTMTTTLTRLSVRDLETEDLKEIIQELNDVPEGHLCTVQLVKLYSGAYELYGIYYQNDEELLNDKSIWRSTYRQAQHFIDIINEELEVRTIWAEYF